MTATNHVVTGALIAAAVRQPYLAVPLALASHVVMDAMPHFGWHGPKNGKIFMAILGADMFCASLVLLALLLSHPAGWLLMVACAIAAASPDLLWLYYLPYELRHGHAKRYNIVGRFLARIQWAEWQSWPGFAIELAWLVLTTKLLLGVA